MPIPSPAPTVDPHAQLRAVRDARDRLGRAAALPFDPDLERAVAELVAAAWDAGFLRATVCSVVSVVLERSLPRRGTRPGRRALVARWVRRAGELYDERVVAGRAAAARDA